jgi:hypothetical protein
LVARDLDAVRGAARIAVLQLELRTLERRPAGLVDVRGAAAHLEVRIGILHVFVDAEALLLGVVFRIARLQRPLALLDEDIALQ